MALLSITWDWTLLFQIINTLILIGFIAICVILAIVLFRYIRKQNDHKNNKDLDYMKLKDL